MWPYPNLCTHTIAGGLVSCQLETRVTQTHVLTPIPPTFSAAVVSDAMLALSRTWVMMVVVVGEGGEW